MKILFLIFISTEANNRAQETSRQAKEFVTPFGTVLGSNDGVIGYSNGNDDYISHERISKGVIYVGMKWQCVEYSKR